MGKENFRQLSLADFLPENKIDYTCFSTRVTFRGTGVKRGECPFRDLKFNCSDCDAFLTYYDTVYKYEKDHRVNEAHFLAHLELGIPNAYDEYGRISMLMGEDDWEEFRDTYCQHFVDKRCHYKDSECTKDNCPYLWKEEHDGN